MCRDDRSNTDPRWRDLLETRWRAQVREVTELSLAYHAAAEAGEDRDEARRLMYRTVAVRRELADTEEALRRLSVGEFGYCEWCGSAIPSALLLDVPESRYCPRCAAETGSARDQDPARRQDTARLQDTVGLGLG